MADELTPVKVANSDRGILSSRGETVLALIAVALLVAALALGWRAYIYQEEGDPVASAMLAFEKQNSLVVFSSRFEVVAESTNTRGFAGIDLLENRQAAIIPASVEYRLNLSDISADSFEWDAESQELNVILPRLQTSRPNLDEAKARIFTDGVWVTRDDARELAANNSEQAERRAQTFAKNPEILSLARKAAKSAVRQNLTVPLQVAGYENARLNVRFEDEL
ncbi:DUF4230 domain-containing protein [Erythrobacter crassostreae]|uniref:DUF4230 domain-containing protein n=1 Tax=Erythrobacter crassostreae TaxID=2828328 RepID=A0A9X1JM83_9SPHN|nr:DUF4230 domain-containing protein [Erythrobacter crassostrea]MBV7259134.1 DUF4230 domain-containing protein [Erythrobacter crassostrea]